MELTDEQLQMIEANNGEVPPELASILLNGYGETGTPSPESSAPNTAQVSDNLPADAGQAKPEGEANTEQSTSTQSTDTAQPPNEADLTADNAVVIAKDGKHTIPFERLTEARESAQQYKQQAEVAVQQLAEFQQKMAEQSSQPQTQQAQQNQATAEAVVEASGNNAEVMALFGDFSEKSIAEGVDKLLTLRVPGVIQSAVDKALLPYQQQQQALQQNTAYSSHMDTILGAHPDAQSVVESVEFNKWLDEQPNVTRNAYNAVLDQGSATDVNEVLSLYKTQNNSSVNTAEPGKIDPVEVAKQAVQKAQTQVPHSVSDFPAGSPAGVSRDERLASMSPQQLADEMSGWKSEEIEAYMNRNA